MNDKTLNIVVAQRDAAERERDRYKAALEAIALLVDVNADEGPFMARRALLAEKDASRDQK